MSATRSYACVVLAVTVAVVAGCGSSPSAEQKWADGVCTDVANWQKQLKQSTDAIRAQLQSPKAGTLATIKTEIGKAGDATQQLASNLKAKGAPKTDGGTQAKQQLDSLGSQLDATVNRAKQALAGIPQGASLTQTLSTLGPLAPQISSLASSASNTLKSVQAHGKALKEGFQKAGSCKQFR